MRTFRYIAPGFIVLALLLPNPQARSQTVVFSQEGFPTIDSEEVSTKVLRTALGSDLTFLNLDQLQSGDWVETTKLLVRPYGSAFPEEAEPAFQMYLHKGGNLLILGGQPLRVPVLHHTGGSFIVEAPQDSYSKTIDFRQ